MCGGSAENGLERLGAGARCLLMFDASRRSELEGVKVTESEHLDIFGYIT